MDDEPVEDDALAGDLARLLADLPGDYDNFEALVHHGLTTQPQLVIWPMRLHMHRQFWGRMSSGQIIGWSHRGDH